MEDEKTMELWAETKGIEISNLGNSKDPITIHKGHRTIRKRITIKQKVQIKGVEKTLTKEIKKRYLVARLVLECFPSQLVYQEEGLGNHKGKGIVVWEDGNELNDRADNLRWHWEGAGWTEEQMENRRSLVQKAIEELGLTETWSEYYASIKK